MIFHGRMKETRQLQRIKNRILDLWHTKTPASCLDKAHIKPRVMCDQHGIPDKIDEFTQLRLEFRRILNHIVRDIRQAAEYYTEYPHAD